MTERGTNKRTIRYVGSPDALLNFTPEQDAADFTIALITSEHAERGGFFRFWSDTFSFRQLKEAFETVRPDAQAELQKTIDLDAIYEAMVKTFFFFFFFFFFLKEASKAAGPAFYQSQLWKIVGLEYGYYLPSGKLLFEAVDADKFPDCRRTTIADYIRENDYV